MYKTACPKVMIIIPISIEKCVTTVCWFTAPLSYLNSSIATRPKLHFANIVTEPVQQRLPTYHVPNLILIFYCLDHSKELVQV